ncbi:uncharacterized protein LOC135091885 [Scylla paramamosain]|uniref:uncharacterized protein LOC135091885 n=1 Tax=Scylla paramamosain TaxID=85552 RepID=UPI003083B98C
MQCLWRMWAASVVVAAVVVAGVQGEEEWEWRHSRKASSIPGYVEPTTSTSTSTTTTTPPVTTFHPAFSTEQRSRTMFRGASANPYFLMMVGTHRQPHDGTTKSRVVVDTPLDEDGPEPLVLGDTYTTVDRLQSARGAPPRLPRPQKHLLGGLHPDEVFYANDDLLITRGGGFHSEVFQEPSQLLHEDDIAKEKDTLTKTSPIMSLPPSPDQEYNGNIPIILPPPTQTRTKPISFLVGGASKSNYVLVPYVYPQAYTKVVHTYPSQITYRYRYYQNPAMLQAVAPLALPHSLVGDTDVNFRHPRPPINPDAEVFVQHPNPTWRRTNL